MPDLETWCASAVWYEDDAHIFFVQMNWWYKKTIDCKQANINPVVAEFVEKNPAVNFVT